MNELDSFEQELLDAYDQGEMVSTTPSKAYLSKFKAAATATFYRSHAPAWECIDGRSCVVGDCVAIATGLF